MIANSLRTTRKITAVVLLLAASAFAQQPRPISTLTESARVEQWKGEVKLQLPEVSPAVPARGLLLPKDTVIETADGSMLLRLQDGSQLLVRPHTRLVLKAPNEDHKHYLELMIGRIVAKVSKRLGNTPSFRLGTPTAVITVRGTRFAVQVNKKHKTIVDVYEGWVEVAGLGAEDRPVLVEPGFSTQVEIGELPELPREVMSPPAPTPAPDTSSSDQSPTQDTPLDQPPQ